MLSYVEKKSMEDTPKLVRHGEGCPAFFADGDPTEERTRSGGGLSVSKLGGGSLCKIQCHKACESVRGDVSLDLDQSRWNNSQVSQSGIRTQKLVGGI